MLGYNIQDLEGKEGYQTALEITQQPEIIESIYKDFCTDREKILGFIKPVINKVDEIILVGAGSSHFIGTALINEIQKVFGKTTQAISTTHLVTHPQSSFNKGKDILLISFARSGNSPESVAAVNLANKHSKRCFHFIFTCNRSGELARLVKGENTYSYFLPEKANDRGLAMTSSYSGMLFAGLLLCRLETIDQQLGKIKILIGYLEQIIHKFNDSLYKLAIQEFDRTVFLGSGTQYGISQEAQLKMLELTDGQVTGNYDSFLGFRHGPKSVINNKTLVIFFFSNSNYVRQYELDLVNSIIRERSSLLLLGFSEAKILPGIMENIISFKEEGDGQLLEDEFFAIVNIVAAQILAFHKSMHLGVSPDNPSKNGVITRVVQGVNIYEFNE